jgi:hypothetical protein
MCPIRFPGGSLGRGKDCTYLLDGINLAVWTVASE